MPAQSIILIPGTKDSQFEEYNTFGQGCFENNIDTISLEGKPID